MVLIWRFKVKMETYHQLIDVLIQGNQACPRLAGLIIEYQKSPSKRIHIIPGTKAKFGVLIRSFAMICMGFLMLLRILDLQANKTEPKLNASEKVYMQLCIITFFTAMVTAERYRIRGYFPEHFTSFVNSLFLMEARYFGGKINF